MFPVVARERPFIHFSRDTFLDKTAVLKTRAMFYEGFTINLQVNVGWILKIWRVFVNFYLKIWAIVGESQILCCPNKSSDR